MNRCLRILWLFALSLAPAFAQDQILTIGILAIQPKAEVAALWKPLAEHLTRVLPGKQFRIEALDYAEMEPKIQLHELDFVLTNPGHYIQLQHQNALSGALVTLEEAYEDQALDAYGGVIFTVKQRGDIERLTDLKGKTLAVSSKASLGGYQAQAYELERAGISIEDDLQLLDSEMMQNQVVEAVLENRADVGFVRTGLLEALAKAGKLDIAKIKIINDQHMPSYPFLLSTRLYPEWPFVAMPHVDEELTRQVTAQLLMIKHEDFAARAGGYHGFSIPLNYRAVEELMRTLRLPPFDAAPSFTWKDISQRYKLLIGVSATAFATIVALAILLVLRNRQLQQAKDRAKSGEQALERIIAGTDAGTWQWNVQTGEVIFNQRWAGICGYDLEELAPLSVKTWQKLTHPDDMLQAEKRLQKHFSGDQSDYEVELRMKHKQGHWIWVLARGRLISRTQEGYPEWMAGTHLNITAKKQAEAEVAHSRNFLRDIIDNIADPIFVKDSEHRWILVNQAFCKLIGHSRDEVVGKSDFDFFPEQEAQVFWDKDNEVIGSGRANVNEATISGRESSLHTIITRKTLLMNAEGQSFLVGIILDITERKNMELALAARERQFRTLAENSPDPIYRYDKHCRRLYVNQAVVRLHGKPMEELVGRTPIDNSLLDSGQNQRLVDAINQVFNNQETVEIDVEINCQSKQHRYYQLSLVPEFDADGQVETVLGLARNITEMRNAEQRMARFLGNVPGFVYSFRKSPEGHFSFPFASAGIKRLFGLSPEQVKDDMAPLHAMLYPKDRLRIENAVAESAQSFSPLYEEIRIQCPDCSERWIETRSVPEAVDDGSIVWNGLMIDITERKQQQARLTMLEQALNQTKEAAFLYDESGNILYVNQEACTSLDYGREALLGMAMYEIDVLGSANETAQLLESNGGYRHVTFEGKQRRKDGQIIPVEITTAIIDYEGKNLGMSLVRNISERKAAEQQLHLLNYALGHVSGTVELLNEHGQFLYVNDETCRQLGYRREELLELTVLDIDPNLSPELWLMHWATLKENGVLEFETVHKTKRGYCFPVELNISYFEFDGIGYNLALGKDITERKYLEKQLQKQQNALIDAQRIAHYGSWELDVVDNLFCGSEQFYKIFEIVEDRRASSYTAFIHAIHPDDLDRVNKGYMEAQTHGTCFKMEYRLLMADGRIKYISERGEPQLNEDGVLVRILGTVHDITERKEMEAILKEREEQLVESQRLAQEQHYQAMLSSRLEQSHKMEAVGTLAAGIAHDFNNLLGSIIGFAEMAEDDLPEDSAGRQCIQQVVIAGFRARDIVARLLMFARKNPSNPSDAANVVAISQETLALIGVSYQPKLRFIFSSEVESAAVMADPGQLQQVVMNLCINAADAMEHLGEVNIHIAIVHDCEIAALAEQNCVCLSVADNGTGIAPDVQKRIFDPFFTTKAPNKGSGLGLSVVYGIVKQLGGEIEVHSQTEGENRGTEFRVFLPLAESESLAAAKIQATSVS